MHDTSVICAIARGLKTSASLLTIASATSIAKLSTNVSIATPVKQLARMTSLWQFSRPNHLIHRLALGLAGGVGGVGRGGRGREGMSWLFSTTPI